MAETKALIKVGMNQQFILPIPGVKVTVDSDLAEAYGVPTLRLNERTVNSDSCQNGVL